MLLSYRHVLEFELIPVETVVSLAVINIYSV